MVKPWDLGVLEVSTAAAAVTTDALADTLLDALAESKPVPTALPSPYSKTTGEPVNIAQ